MLSELLDWRPFAEIAILATGYFFILSAIRGTRGAAMLKGLVFVVVVAFIGAMWASDKLGLERIKQMLQWLLSGSFVALVIIFTPEMRRALLRLAQSPLLSPLLHGPSLQMVDELVNTVVKLSKNRIGALIAVERENGLGEYIEKGQRLDAVMTGELIESLFYPGSALHDGAVIVQHDRIAAAGCLLPLTDNPALSKSMGTRHRAAIGLSEETDAIVIVVSEESGKISLCVEGKMKSDLTRENLEKELRDLYTRSERIPWRGDRTRRAIAGENGRPPVPEPGNPGAGPPPGKEGDNGHTEPETPDVSRTSPPRSEPRRGTTEKRKLGDDR